jgi:malate dehydrogenase (oxaloacetate-decarboxylating)
MDEKEVFAEEAADVAMEAIKNGVARIKLTRKEVYNTTLHDISEARAVMELLMKKNFIKEPDIALLRAAARKAIDAVK